MTRKNLSYVTIAALCLIFAIYFGFDLTNQLQQYHDFVATSCLILAAIVWICLYLIMYGKNIKDE